MNSDKKKQKHISNNAKLKTKRTERRLLLIHGTESVDTWRWRVLSRTYDLILRFPNMKQITLLSDTDAWLYRSMKEYRKQPEGRRIVDHASRPAKRTFSFI